MKPKILVPWDIKDNNCHSHFTLRIDRTLKFHFFVVNIKCWNFHKNLDNCNFITNARMRKIRNRPSEKNLWKFHTIGCFLRDAFQITLYKFHLLPIAWDTASPTRQKCLPNLIFVFHIRFQRPGKHKKNLSSDMNNVTTYYYFQGTFGVLA